MEFISDLIIYNKNKVPLSYRRIDKFMCFSKMLKMISTFGIVDAATAVVSAVLKFLKDIEENMK